MISYFLSADLVSSSATVAAIPGTPRKVQWRRGETGRGKYGPRSAALGSLESELGDRPRCMKAGKPGWSLSPGALPPSPSPQPSGAGGQVLSVGPSRRKSASGG